MPLKNPIVIGFSKVLKKGYQRREIVHMPERRPISSHEYYDLANAMFQPLTDADGRREIILNLMHDWKHKGHWHFPPYVMHALKAVRSNLKSKGFWDHVLDVTIEVTSSPIFSAVIGAATAAIPGVGAALAPVAVMLQRKVTDMVKEAHEGKSISAGEVLSSAAQVAAAGAGAAAAISPAAGALVDKAKTIVATARTVYESPAAHELRTGLLEARKLIVKAQSGDAHAAAEIQSITHKAKAGHKDSIVRLAHLTAVAHGMRQGHIPRATKEEKRHYGRIALLKFGKLSPALQALARAAAHPMSPIAKLPVPTAETSTGHDDEDDDRDDDDLKTPEEKYSDDTDEINEGSDADSYDDDTGAVTFRLQPGVMRAMQQKQSPKRAAPRLRLPPMKATASAARLRLPASMMKAVAASVPAHQSRVVQALTARKIAAVAPAIKAALANGDHMAAAETLAAAKQEAKEEAATVPSAVPAGVPGGGGGFGPMSGPDDEGYEDEDDYEDEDAA